MTETSVKHARARARDTAPPSWDTFRLTRKWWDRASKTRRVRREARESRDAAASREAPMVGNVWDVGMKEEMQRQRAADQHLAEVQERDATRAERHTLLDTIVSRIPHRVSDVLPDDSVPSVKYRKRKQRGQSRRRVAVPSAKGGRRKSHKKPHPAPSPSSSSSSDSEVHGDVYKDDDDDDDIDQSEWDRRDLAHTLGWKRTLVFQAPPAMRSSFLSRIYSIVIVQLAFTVSVVYYVSTHPTIRRDWFEHVVTYVVTFVLLAIVMLVYLASHFYQWRRTYQALAIVLVTLTCTSALILISVAVDTHIFVRAVVLSMGVLAILFVLALQTCVPLTVLMSFGVVLVASAIGIFVMVYAPNRDYLTHDAAHFIPPPKDAVESLATLVLSMVFLSFFVYRVNRLTYQCTPHQYLYGAFVAYIDGLGVLAVIYKFVTTCTVSTSCCGSGQSIQRGPIHSMHIPMGDEY